MFVCHECFELVATPETLCCSQYPKWMDQHEYYEALANLDAEFDRIEAQSEQN